MLAVDLEDLVADFDRQRLTRNSGVALIRRDGVMLARAPFVEGYLGVSVAGNRLFREYLPQAPTAVRRFRTDATDNVERIVGYSQLQDYPLIVVVASSVDDVLVDWRQKRNGLLWAAAMLSLLSLGVTLHLSRLLAALDRRQDDLEHLATVDTMTGALNRAAFFAALSRESDRAARYGTPLTAMMFDLDFFKRINDAYGHAVGDEALKLFAAAVASELRNVDAFGRIGGEEFVALLPNTAVGAAQQLAERLREKVALIRIESEAHDAVRFTVSVGVAELAREGDWVEGGDAMLKRADEALYEAKKSGRNRVLTSQPKPRRRDETGRN
jgi:diguanylate cyclase (GGDEF)-like protein